jgi:hypothetical protein
LAVRRRRGRIRLVNPRGEERANCNFFSVRIRAARLFRIGNRLGSDDGIVVI